MSFCKLEIVNSLNFTIFSVAKFLKSLCKEIKNQNNQFSKTKTWISNSNLNQTKLVRVMLWIGHATLSIKLSLYSPFKNFSDCKMSGLEKKKTFLLRLSTFPTWCIQIHVHILIPGSNLDWSSDFRFIIRYRLWLRFIIRYRLKFRFRLWLVFRIDTYSDPVSGSDPDSGSDSGSNKALI